MNVPTESVGFKKLLGIAFLPFSFCFLYSIAVFTLEEAFGDHFYSISPQTGSVFGIAVAFFLGFRMNSAYDRWWEARKNIGELTYNSRNFSAKVCTYFCNKENLSNESKSQNYIIGKTILDLLRLYLVQFQKQLHNQSDIDPNVFSVDNNLSFLPSVKNKPNHILQTMSQKIEQSFNNECSMEKYDLMVLINKFYEIQGKSERTKNTPFLNIYKAFTRLIVVFYVLLLPFFMGDIDLGGENSYWELFAIPVITLIGTIFLTINKLSNLFGDPFSQSATSFPLTEIIENISAEVNDVINYFDFLARDIKANNK
jgi:putative membrane protein